MDGSRTIVSFKESERTLLFVMKASCTDCKATVPIWNSLTAALRTESVKILAVSVDSLEIALNYFARLGIKFPVVSAPDGLFLANYRIVATPQTLVINGSG